MFGWFKKRATPHSESVPQVLQRFVKPMALATALAETISEYEKTVRSGKASSPAYQRKGESVVGIWNDTRLEALRHLWGYGASDATLLADHRQQKKLLDALFQDKPQYEYPYQHSGEPIHDTLQALFQVYLYLSKAGSAVADKETDSLSLKLNNKNIFSDFEEQAKSLRELWGVFEQAVRRSSDLPSVPSTILEALYRDVTKKAKSIALTARFGPNVSGKRPTFFSLAARCGEWLL